MYIYQREHWPNFTWNNDHINQSLLPIKFKEGRFLGKMESLGFDMQVKAGFEILTTEIIKTSEIEGEHLNLEEVRSSIARHLGIETSGLLPTGRHVDGIVEMLLDATHHYSEKLTFTRLCGWHSLLFPTGLSGLMLVNPGVLRMDSEGPMQVVSGVYGRNKVHFQAPPANILEKQVKLFLKWFNTSHEQLDLLLKAAISHLWFITLHPFDDGNGRIARAITDMALARAEDQAHRFYSMSAQIRLERNSYYDILEKTQQGSIDITQWLLWFLDCLAKAIGNADSLLETVLNKAKFWEKNAGVAFHSRQIQMLNLLFDGFKGKLNSGKWAKITKCSQDTANRDINQLIAMGVLVKSKEGGRSTSYLLKDFSINQID
jgi:Fic family protein